MMSVNHIQSSVTSLFWPMLARIYGGASMSNRTLTVVDLTATGVTVNRHFLNDTYMNVLIM